MHSGVRESPQFGLILEKDWIRIWAGRTKSRIRDHFFCDLEFLEFLGEIGFSKSLINVPNRPFWMANLHFYGLEYGEGEKRAVYGSGSFQGKAGAAPQSISCNREPAECERYGGVVWVFRLIGITVNFLPGEWV